MKTSVVHDRVILEGGPTGLTAGLHAARARLNAVLPEGMGFGGLIHTDQESATSVPGITLNGDIRAKEVHRSVTTVGDGASAVLSADRTIETPFH